MQLTNMALADSRKYQYAELENGLELVNVLVCLPQSYERGDAGLSSNVFNCFQLSSTVFSCLQLPSAVFNRVCVCVSMYVTLPCAQRSNV